MTIKEVVGETTRDYLKGVGVAAAFCNLCRGGDCPGGRVIDYLCKKFEERGSWAATAGVFSWLGLESVALGYSFKEAADGIPEPLVIYGLSKVVFRTWDFLSELSINNHARSDENIPIARRP